MDNAKIYRLKQFYTNNNSEFSLDDITFNDLNLNDIFEKIDYTVSSLGEEVLYGMLRQPLTDIEKINLRKEYIDEYSKNINHTNNIQKELKKLSKLKKYSIFEYLYSLDDIKVISLFKQYKAALLMIISLALMLYNVSFGLLVSVIVYFYNSIIYFKLKKDVEPYFICIAYLSKAVSIGNKIDKINKDDLKDIKFLKYSSLLLGTLSGQTVNGGSGNPLDVLLSLFKLGFHIDIIRFYSLVNKVKINRNKINDYLIKLGYIDAYISIVTFRNKALYYSIPDFDNKNEINILEGYHLLNKSPVPNTINIKNSILLTGSNASGKSTFLRMVAVNLVLAQSILTTLTKKYEAGIFKMISAMSVVDSINKQESYYMAEIKAIKRIIDLANDSNVNVICFIDEVLKGTNTKERIAASTKLLEYLDENCLCIAATHDLELTKLLKDKYYNYHFAEEMIDEDVKFSYLLMDGPSDTTNAIKLLEQIGFPKSITDGAYEIINKNNI